MFYVETLIIGAGPAGTATAISSIQNGQRAAILDACQLPRERPGETLHPGIQPLMAQLGVEDELLSAGFMRHQGHWVEWDGERQFEAFGSDENGPWLGFQAWRSDFDAILLRHARQMGVVVRQPCRAVKPLVQEGRVVGVLTSEGALKASFVVDATGGRHWLARHLGIKIKRFSPPLVSWYGYAEGECPARDDAPAIVADGQGWTWTARVRPGVYTWTRLSFDPSLQDKNWMPEEFRGLQPRGKARGADVTWRVVSPTAGPGYFLVGDAAAVLDPASSHGVLKAVMSGMFTAHSIAAIVRHVVKQTEAAAVYNRWISDWFYHDVEKLRELYTVFPRSREIASKFTRAT